MTINLIHLPEPTLSFRHDQAVEDPRDGLTLFGPLDQGKPYGIRAGVVGTRHGIAYFGDWLRRIQGPLTDVGRQVSNPPFPGFSAAFRTPWHPEPALALVVAAEDLHQAVNLDDRHQRVHRTVGVFADRILNARRSEDAAVDVWFVVVPDIVYDQCRPKAVVATELRLQAERKLPVRFARRLRRQPSLFAAENALAVAYHYDVDFHNQLKARLLEHQVLTQIVRESTIFPTHDVPGIERPRRDKRKQQAAVAWSLCTAAFYKAGGRPWKVEGVRDGVCYVGLVFKRDETKDDTRLACCAAQMFLDSGDGIVFKGAIGPWYRHDKEEFHLTREAARELIALAVETYSQSFGGPPAELFIHGKVGFDDEEWRGFSESVDSSRTNVVGVKIREDGDLRLFRHARHPVLRGTAWIRHPRAGHLWTRGLTPRLKSYIGREVPRPLRVEIMRGEADMQVVLSDVLALTKLNYNTCMLADGVPVTLRFADAVGEILTAGPVGPDNPLPFKHYI